MKVHANNNGDDQLDDEQLDKSSDLSNIQAKKVCDFKGKTENR